MSEHALGDPAIRTNVLLQVFIVGELSGELLGRELRGTGLSPDHFAVLSVISSIGPITPTDLSRVLGMPATTVSSWIRRLAVRKQVTRRVNPDDGRSALLEITPAGRSAIKEAQPIFMRLLGEVEEGLGARREGVVDGFVELQEVLRKLSARENTTKS
ncbi:MAG TPA: MarR family transcriptional regulator [Gaiellaceae bacterium]|nr:MarR family transcriptional regulator [Gaiellaceae bacterium]